MLTIGKQGKWTVVVLTWTVMTGTGTSSTSVNYIYIYIYIYICMKGSFAMLIFDLPRHCPNRPGISLNTWHDVSCGFDH